MAKQDNFDYSQLDPGIREVVALLRDNGFKTVDSGDGVSKRGTDMESCMSEVPNVSIHCAPSQLARTANRVMALLEGYGVRCGPSRETLEVHCGPQSEDDVYGHDVFVEGWYQPGCGARVTVSGLDDALLRKCDDIQYLSAGQLTPVQARLAWLMSDISEDCFSAGWLCGLEYALWGMVLGDSRKYGQRIVPEERVNRLRELSEACGGWIVWDDELGETWIPTAVWEKRFLEGPELPPWSHPVGDKEIE